jgi:subtilisin family serine protease
MVQTAVKLESRSARHLLTACVGLCLTLPLSTQARSLQWYFDADTTTAAPASMKTEPIEPGQAQVVVAVIDSGVLVDHPALKGKLLPGFDMVSEAQNGVGGRSPNYTPSPKGASCGQRMVSSSFRTHGTEVASIVAGNGHQEMWGVNPNALILPIRVFGPCGMTREDLVDSIRWAAGLPVIVNEHVDTLPFISVTVYVCVFIPAGNIEPLVNPVNTIDNTPQLSEGTGVIKFAVLPQVPGKTGFKILFGQITTGPSVSIPVTLNEH